jgi:hypothetical protein
VRLDVVIVVVVADTRLTDWGQPDWGAVRLDVLCLWLSLLAGLVRHLFSSFGKLHVDSPDVRAARNLPCSSSKTQTPL